jgi:hypothetical protein
MRCLCHAFEFFGARPPPAKTLAKKHRISVEDAGKILAEHGSDRKAADKAARRVAV